MFGGATTFVNWAVYILSLLVFPLAVSNAIAWIVAVSFAFVVNKKYVFRSSDLSFKKVIAELSKFFAGRILTGILEIVGLPLLVYAGLNQTIFGIEGALAKIIIGVVVVVSNYLFSKFIVFRKKAK